MAHTQRAFAGRGTGIGCDSIETPFPCDAKFLSCLRNLRIKPLFLRIEVLFLRIKALFVEMKPLFHISVGARLTFRRQENTFRLQRARSFVLPDLQSGSFSGSCHLRTSNCSFQSLRYKPSFCESSSCVPSSFTSPLCSTIIRSACFTVLSLWLSLIHISEPTRH